MASENSPLRMRPARPSAKSRGGFLAIGRYQFGKGGEQTGLRQAVAVDALDARFGPRLVQIAERSAFLLVVRNVTGSFGRLRCHAQCQFAATSPAAIPTRRHVSMRARARLGRHF